VYDLVTNVIEETSDFYAYHDISLVRLQLLQNERFIQYGKKRITVKKALQRYGITTKEGKFLFRIANHFKPRTILSVGSSMGLVPLCLTRYDSTVRCITLECEPDLAEIAGQILNKEKNPALSIQTGAYQELLPDSIVELQQIDCVFIGKDVSVNDWDTVFEQCESFIHDSTFLVLAGIRSSNEKKYYWTQFRQHPSVTVAIDLFDLGLLFFQPKLHKQIYKTILS
jgi:predicted O-methyltransferase YrrM